MPNRPKVNFKPEKWVPIDELKPHPRNPRVDLRENEAQFNSLKESILEGVFEPIKVSRSTGFCLAGNQRLKAYADLGYDEVPVQYNDCADEKEEIQIIIKDNNEWGAYNYVELNGLLNDFDLNLDSLGLNGDDMNFLGAIDEKSEKEAKEDDVPEVEAKSLTQIGDIFQLGKHRLMCGDSTNPEHIEALMANAKADMVFTDPPYNVNYKGSGKKTSNTIENDNMTPEAFQAFLDATFESYKLAVKSSAPFYVCHSSSSQRAFEDAMEKVGLKTRNQIIWNKTLASMGWGDYRWKHEPIFYATFEGKNTQFYGDRCQYTVWDEKWDADKLIKKIKEICEKQEKGGSTIWTLKRDQNYVHPTQKPIELIEIAIANSSKSEDLVLDLFGGSGSVIIACEKSNRIGYSMELDPRYVDVICARWAEYTGNKPVKLTS